MSDRCAGGSPSIASRIDCSTSRQSGSPVSADQARNCARVLGASLIVGRVYSWLIFSPRRPVGRLPGPVFSVAMIESVEQTSLFSPQQNWRN